MFRKNVVRTTQLLRYSLFVIRWLLNLLSWEGFNGPHNTLQVISEKISQPISWLVQNTNKLNISTTKGVISEGQTT